jgi:hypothetical protein
MIVLGRDDLIFPVQYISVKKVQAAETVFGENLVALRRRQWIDFVPLLYVDPRSPEVRKWAGALAESILDAMRRPVPAVPIGKVADHTATGIAATGRITGVEMVESGQRLRVCSRWGKRCFCPCFCSRKSWPRDPRRGARHRVRSGDEQGKVIGREP